MSGFAKRDKITRTPEAAESYLQTTSELPPQSSPGAKSREIHATPVRHSGKTTSRSALCVSSMLINAIYVLSLLYLLTMGIGINVSVCVSVVHYVYKRVYRDYYC